MNSSKAATWQYHHHFQATVSMQQLVQDICTYKSNSYYRYNVPVQLVAAGKPGGFDVQPRHVHTNAMLLTTLYNIVVHCCTTVLYNTVIHHCCN